MKKKQRNILAGIAIVVLILILLYSFGGIKLPFVDAPAIPIQCSGGKALSIDQVRLATSDDLSGKQVIRVTYSTVPSAECLYISLDPSTINDKLSDQDKQIFEATKRVIGDIVLTKSQKVYNINERSTEVYKDFNLNPGSPRDWAGFCTDNKCQDTFGTTNFITSPTGSYDGADPNWYNKCGATTCCCVYHQSGGVNGEFSDSTEYRWTTKVSIASQSIELSQNKLYGKIGDIATVEWSGNGLGNSNLESISNRQAYKPYSNNQWRMTDVVWSDLNNKWSGLYNRFQECENFFGGGGCEPELKDAIAYKAELTSATTDKLSQWIAGNTMVKNAVINSNQLIVDLQSPIVYPTFTLDIDAQEVGIFKSYGVPDVTCPTVPSKLQSGNTMDVQGTVKNIGANSGSFEWSVACNKGSQIVSPAPPKIIPSGSTEPITFRLGLTVPEGEDTSSCTFTASSGTRSDSCTFSYTAQHQGQCTTGTKSCEVGNSELWTCRADGGYDILKCPGGCYQNATGFDCRGAIQCDPPNSLCADNTCRLDCSEVKSVCKSCDDYAMSYLLGSVWKSKQCEPKGWTLKWSFFFISPPQGTTSCLLSFVKLILVPIVFIFGLLFSIDFLSSFKSLKGKKKNIWRFVIALALATLLAMLVYFVFIVGLIIFILFMVLRVAIKTGLGYMGVR